MRTVLRQVRNIQERFFLMSRLLYLAFTGLLLLPVSGWAVCFSPNEVVIPFPEISINGGNEIPVHSPNINSQLTWNDAPPSEIMDWFSCSERGVEGGTAVLRPVGAQIGGIGGFQYADQYGTYAVFDLPAVPGVGYVMRVKTQDTNWVAVGPGAETVIRTLTSTQTRTRLEVSATLIVYGTPQTGHYVFPRALLAEWGLRKPSGEHYAPMGWVPVYTDSGSLTLNAVACEVTSPTDQVAVLRSVGRTEFSGVGSTAPTSTRFQFSLNCAPMIALHATMSDGLSPGNSSTILSLAPDSTATGVGIQVFRDGQATPIAFGPDSPIAGTLNQWYVGTGASSYVLPFEARYVQTEESITPGSVRSLATITFSYQ